MTYREKLELYSQGKLDEKERIEIEKDLEKQEALADYLFEHEAPPGMEDFFDGESPFAKPEEPADAKAAHDDSDEIAKQISKSIRKAFIKTGVIATIVALILTLFIVFALPHIVSAFYYNPSKSIGTDENGTKIEQLERDMSVYAELSIPELGPQITVGTDSYGYGNYSYYINSSFQVGTDEYTTVDKVLTGNIKRNSVTCYNLAELSQFRENDCLSTEFDDVSKSMRQMNDQDLYYAYVAFDGTMPYEKFYADFVDHDKYGTNGSWVWCGVQISDDENATEHYYNGFYATTYQDIPDYPYDEAAYPALISEKDEELDTEKEAAQHFNSMISYLKDNQKFASLKNHLDLEHELWSLDEAGDYVANHGINVYGFIYVGDKEHIETISKAKGVCQVSVRSID